MSADQQLKRLPKRGERVRCYMPYGSVEGVLIAVHEGRGWVSSGSGDYIWDLDNMETLAKKAGGRQ